MLMTLFCCGIMPSCGMAQENKQEQPLFVELKQSKKAANLPKWLDFDPATLTGTVLAAPTREDIDMSIQEHMIVELYSK